MKTGKQIFYERAAEKGVIVKGNMIPMGKFCEIGLPMIVACTGCTTTMNLFSCVVDEEQKVWCSDCAGNPQVEDVDPWVKYQVNGYKRIVKVPQRPEITQRQIEIKYGSEGPRNDSYAYTEYIVKQNGYTVTLHDGITEWIQVKGCKEEIGEDDPFETFEKLTGFNKGSFIRAIETRRSRCPKCGKTTFHIQRGFPGEHLVVCDKCNRVIDAEFCESEII